MTDAAELSHFLDGYLKGEELSDYPGAVNGLQITNSSPITCIAAAVDFSLRTMTACAENGANFLIVHHGMFWGGSKAFVGSNYQRVKYLIERDLAVYSSHLPLDRHPVSGNNALLASELQLEPSSGFAHHNGVAIGLAGECDVATSELIQRIEQFALRFDGNVVARGILPERRTKRWGMCTGAGASAETLAEAAAAGIDTLIVGEGPHWTAVAAEDDGVAIIYAGHYATETLGVQAVAKIAAEKFGLPWRFIHVPTGL